MCALVGSAFVRDLKFALFPVTLMIREFRMTLLGTDRHHRQLSLEHSVEYTAHMTTALQRLQLLSWPLSCGQVIH